MKKLLISMVFLLSLVACNKTDQPGANLGVGDKIPAFAATMNNGSVITDLAFNEKIGLIAFFNTNCIDCVKELPVLQKVWEKYLTNIVFCPISREQGAEAIAKYWSDNKLSMPYSPQEDRTLYNKFASSGIPRIYIVANGIITKIWTDSYLPTFEDIDEYLQNAFVTIDFSD